MTLNVALFLVIIAAAVAFGWWWGARWAFAARLIDAILAEHHRDCAVEDAADMAETADEKSWGVRRDDH